MSNPQSHVLFAALTHEDPAVMRGLARLAKGLAVAAAVATAVLLSGCGGAPGQIEADPVPPSCSDYGFQLAVGQPVKLQFAQPVALWVLGGEAEISIDGASVTLLILTSDDSTPRVLGAEGSRVLAAEVRACNGTENAWPVAIENL